MYLRHADGESIKGRVLTLDFGATPQAGLVNTCPGMILNCQTLSALTWLSSIVTTYKKIVQKQDKVSSSEIKGIPVWTSQRTHAQVDASNSK